MSNKLDYDRCYSHMMRCNWNLDEVLPINSRFDFTKELIPGRLTLHHHLKSSIANEQIKILNHITAKSYLNFFHFVEEFIIKKTEQISNEKVDGTTAQKAFSQFHTEEIKHQKLFERAMDYIDVDLNPQSKVVDFEEQAAYEMLKLNPISLLLLIYHLEIITQEHYLQSVKSDKGICDLIRNILQYHWIEESQHANLDKIELYSNHSDESEEVQYNVVSDFFNALSQMAEIFLTQAEYDFQSFNQITNDPLTNTLKPMIIQKQYHSYINLFILNGLEHKSMKRIVYDLFPASEDLFNIKRDEWTAVIN